MLNTFSEYVFHTVHDLVYIYMYVYVFDTSNKSNQNKNRIYSCFRERSEGGYKLMQNVSAEEQQALKPITRCAKITVDLTHEEQLLFYAQIKKNKKSTGTPGFTARL